MGDGNLQDLLTSGGISISGAHKKDYYNGGGTKWQYGLTFTVNTAEEDKILPLLRYVTNTDGLGAVPIIREEWPNEKYPVYSVGVVGKDGNIKKEVAGVVSLDGDNALVMVKKPNEKALEEVLKAAPVTKPMPPDEGSKSKVSRGYKPPKFSLKHSGDVWATVKVLMGFAVVGGAAYYLLSTPPNKQTLEEFVLKNTPKGSNNYVVLNDSTVAIVPLGSKLGEGATIKVPEQAENSKRIGGWRFVIPSQVVDKNGGKYSINPRTVSLPNIDINRYTDINNEAAGWRYNHKEDWSSYVGKWVSLTGRLFKGKDGEYYLLLPNGRNKLTLNPNGLSRALLEYYTSRGTKEVRVDGRVGSVTPWRDRSKTHILGRFDTDYVIPVAGKTSMLENIRRQTRKSNAAYAQRGVNPNYRA